MQKINKHFISDIDKKCAKFDQDHAPEPQQLDEIEKYKKIYHIRDHGTDSDERDETSLWD